jgi:hypothetical protein
MPPGMKSNSRAAAARRITFRELVMCPYSLNEHNQAILTLYSVMQVHQCLVTLRRRLQI